MATTTRKAGPPNHTDSAAICTSTAAESTRSRKLDQSKRLAGGKDIIDFGAAITSFAGLILLDRSAQGVRAIVRPENVLKHQLGVGGFP